ncbi:BA14K family protein [Pararhizobium sp.]|uniref:BA14K family protein n=1 Tax=Pararhizobium sp. TaxID=1977563 RepID=UPI00272635E4|nr:BA14K family protein [Pararhizobium sp.]MDO9416457.1 BA14K family protein [Pararhizobium sp.]
MQNFYKMIGACALGVATLLTPVAPAQAVPLASTVTMERSTDVENVRHRGYYHRRHHRPYYGRDYVRPGFGIYIGPRYGYRERSVRRGGYNRHVNWCLSRYQSYNPGTNRFLAYGGVYKVCRSPFR